MQDVRQVAALLGGKGGLEPVSASCLKSQGLTMPTCWRKLDWAKKTPGGRGCLCKWVLESLPHSVMESGRMKPRFSPSQ